VLERAELLKNSRWEQDIVDGCHKPKLQITSHYDNIRQTVDRDEVSRLGMFQKNVTIARSPSLPWQEMRSEASSGLPPPH
jgi:hypothetical protein